MLQPRPVGLFNHLVGALGQALGQALAAHALELLVDAHAFRQVVDREVRLAQLDLDIALVGDLHRVGDGLRAIVERCLHLLHGLEVQLRGAHAHAFLVQNGALGADAQEDVVGLGVVFRQVVAVVGGHEGEPRFLGHFKQHLVGAGLLRDAVLLELQVEAVREDGRVLACDGDA